MLTHHTAKTIVMPLPSSDFDPTEIAVTWQILARAGHRVIFATPEAEVSAADPKMVTGKGLGVLGMVLRADAHGRDAYQALLDDENFNQPLSYSTLRVEDFDGLILGGGHAVGMKSYLESIILQQFVALFFESHKPIGAICHGVVLAARCHAPSTGQSVLYGKKTTALPEFMELGAWALTKYKVGDYYRTYPITVQKEVSLALKQPSDFIVGPILSLRAALRDSPTKLHLGFTVQDGQYLSARWPGDAHRFATEFLALLR
jgi:putative intracellular protease/amidase